MRGQLAFNHQAKLSGPQGHQTAAFLPVCALDVKSFVSDLVENEAAYPFPGSYRAPTAPRRPQSGCGDLRSRHGRSRRRRTACRRRRCSVGRTRATAASRNDHRRPRTAAAEVAEKLYTPTNNMRVVSTLFWTRSGTPFTNIRNGSCPGIGPCS